MNTRNRTVRTEKMFVIRRNIAKTTTIALMVLAFFVACVGAMSISDGTSGNNLVGAAQFLGGIISLVVLADFLTFITSAEEGLPGN